MDITRRWVNDRLHDILGISDRTLADYFISLGQKSSTPDRLIDELRRTGTVDLDDKVERFCQELWGRFPRATPQSRQSLSTAANLQTEALLQKKNQVYRPLLSDDEDDTQTSRQKS